MTDSQRIEEGAIIGAKEDFEAINEWLEKKKEQVRDFQIEKPSKLYGALSLVSLGFFLGTKTNPKLRWLFSGLGLGTTGYLLFKMWNEMKLEKKREQTDPSHESEIYIGKTQVEEKPEQIHELKNVKVIN